MHLIDTVSLRLHLGQLDALQWRALYNIICSCSSALRLLPPGSLVSLSLSAARFAIPDLLVLFATAVRRPSSADAASMSLVWTAEEDRLQTCSPSASVAVRRKVITSILVSLSLVQSDRVWLSVRLFVRPLVRSVRLSVRPSFRPTVISSVRPVGPSVWPSVSPACRSVRPSIRPSIRPSVRPVGP